MAIPNKFLCLSRPRSQPKAGQAGVTSVPETVWILKFGYCFMMGVWNLVFTL